MDVKTLARQERADIAEFLATLPAQQWEAPTLCAGWRVRDVVAHMISYDELDGRALIGRLAKGRCAARICRAWTGNPVSPDGGGGHGP